MQANMQQALLGAFHSVVVSKDPIPDLDTVHRTHSFDLALTFTDRRGTSSPLDAILHGRRKVRGDIAGYNWSMEDKWTLIVPLDEAKEFAQARGIDTTNPRAFNECANELRRRLATVTLLAGPDQAKISFQSFYVSVMTSDQ